MVPSRHVKKTQKRWFLPPFHQSDAANPEDSDISGSSDSDLLDGVVVMHRQTKGLSNRTVLPFLCGEGVRPWRPIHGYRETISKIRSGSQSLLSEELDASSASGASEATLNQDLVENLTSLADETNVEGIDISEEEIPLMSIVQILILTQKLTVQKWKKVFTRRLTVWQSNPFIQLQGFQNWMTAWTGVIQ